MTAPDGTWPEEDEALLDRALLRVFETPAPRPMTPSVLSAIEAAAGLPPGVFPREADETGSQDGRYLVKEEIGRGGAGVVFECVDRDFGREVALKVLRRERASSEGMLRRFVEEARIEGRLEHPGIVPVYDLGVVREGIPYYAMKLVRGIPLSALLTGPARRSTDRPRLVEIFGRVCHAVACAHARGVVHRDLKPANVMLGDYGEVQVLDWGLAKLVGEGPEAPAPDPGPPVHQPLDSVAGTVVGTPAYMAPEQARGDPSVDRRADVFSLGAILCEILTGEPPWEGTGLAQLEKAMHARLDGARARLAACGAEPALTGLCLRCLAASPEERPGDAVEVAGAVSDWLGEQEEIARRAEREALETRLSAEREAERAGEASRRAEWERHARRRTLLAAAAVLVAAALGAGLILRERGREHERANTTASAAGEALREAASLEGAGDLEGAAARAREALDRARAGGAGDETLERAESESARLARRAEEAREAVRREEEDRRLLAALEEVRPLLLSSSMTETGAGYGLQFDSDRSAVDGVYGRVFAEYGFQVHGSTPGELSGAIRFRPRCVEIASEFALWALVRRSLDEGEPVWRTLLEAADLADPDETRTSLRAAIPSGDAGRLAVLARSVDPGNLPAASAQLIGRGLSFSGQVSEAAEFLTRYTAAEAADPWLLADLAFCWLAMTPARSERAACGMMRALALRPDLPRLLDVAGVALAHAGDYGQALLLHEEAGARAGLSAHHLYWHGTTLLLAGEWERGAELLRKSLEIEPDQAPALCNLGGCLFYLGRDKEAVEVQLRALEIEPGSGRVRMNYATTLMMQKRTAEALHEGRRAMAGGARHPLALMQFGWILLSAGEVQEARQVAEAALAQDDSSGLAHYLLGVICCDHLGDLDRAIEEFGKAIARGGDMGTFYRSLGIARRKKGDLPGALEAFHKAAENRQGVARARVWNDLAWCEKDAGDWAGAIHACRQALAAAPDWINPRNLLAWLLADCPDPALRDLDEAQRLAEEAVAMRPQGPFALLMLGLARYRAGRFEEAAQVLETSVRGLETEEALWLLSMAHAKLGNGEAARQWAERARRHVRPPQRKALDILADYRAEAEQVLEETGR